MVETDFLLYLLRDIGIGVKPVGRGGVRIDVEPPFNLAQHLPEPVHGSRYTRRIPQQYRTVAIYRGCQRRIGFGVVMQRADLPDVCLPESLQRISAGAAVTAVCPGYRLRGVGRGILRCKNDLPHGHGRINRDISAGNTAARVDRPLGRNKQAEIFSGTGGILVSLRHFALPRAGGQSGKQEQDSQRRRRISEHPHHKNPSCILLLLRPQHGVRRRQNAQLAGFIRQAALKEGGVRGTERSVSRHFN